MVELSAGRVEALTLMSTSRKGRNPRRSGGKVFGGIHSNTRTHEYEPGISRNSTHECECECGLGTLSHTHEFGSKSMSMSVSALMNALSHKYDSYECRSVARC